MMSVSIGQFIGGLNEHLTEQFDNDDVDFTIYPGNGGDFTVVIRSLVSDGVDVKHRGER